MLNRSGRHKKKEVVDTEILALTPVLEGTCPVFHMNEDVAAGFAQMPLLALENALLFQL